MAYTFTELPFGTAGATLSIIGGNMAWEKIGPADYVIAYLARLNSSRYLMIQHVAFNSAGVPTFDKPYMLGQCLADETYLAAAPLNLDLVKVGTGHLTLSHSYALVQVTTNEYQPSRGVVYHVAYDDQFRFWNNGAIFNSAVFTPNANRYQVETLAGLAQVIPVDENVAVLIRPYVIAANVARMQAFMLTVDGTGNMAIGGTAIADFSINDPTAIPSYGVSYPILASCRKYDQQGNMVGVFSYIAPQGSGGYYGKSRNDIIVRPYKVTDGSGNVSYSLNVYWTGGTTIPHFGHYLPYQPDGQAQNVFNMIRPAGAGAVNGVPDYLAIASTGAGTLMAMSSPANWRQEATKRAIIGATWLDDQHFMLLTSGTMPEDSGVFGPNYCSETSILPGAQLAVEVGRYTVGSQTLEQSPGVEMVTGLNVDSRGSFSQMSLLNSSVVLAFGVMAKTSDPATPASYKPGVLAISL